MTDYSNRPRLLRTVVRRSVIQIFAVPQRDEPPGRSPFRNKEVTIFAQEKPIETHQIPDEISKGIL